MKNKVKERGEGRGVWRKRGWERGKYFVIIYSVPFYLHSLIDSS